MNGSPTALEQGISRLAWPGHMASWPIAGRAGQSRPAGRAAPRGPGPARVRPRYFRRPAGPYLRVRSLARLAWKCQSRSMGAVEGPGLGLFQRNWGKGAEGAEFCTHGIGTLAGQKLITTTATVASGWRPDGESWNREGQSLVGQTALYFQSKIGEKWGYDVLSRASCH